MRSCSTSAFARLERFGVVERRAIDVEMLVHRALSMGSTSPAHLGENMPTMVAEIRAALADVREEVVETRRPGGMADQGWYLKTLPPFITNAIWRSAVASAR